MTEEIKDETYFRLKEEYLSELKRLEQERDELKFENDRYKQLLKGCPTEDEDCGLCVIDEQNKRLKQERDELKRACEKCKLLDIEKTNRDLLERIDELEQENNSLQAQINNITVQSNNVITALEQENKELKELNEQICEDCSKEIKHYWCILEEIRELVIADCKGCTAECDCDEDCTRYIIKNKINEVIE